MSFKFCDISKNFFYTTHSGKCFWTKTKDKNEDVKKKKYEDLEVKRSKMLQKVNNETVFVYILSFIFSYISGAKTNLHNKYMI